MDSLAGAKRIRGDEVSGQRLTLQGRWAAEVEAGEVLEHERDTTEGVATGADEGAALAAYGGDYYLDESYLAKASKHHSGTGGSSVRDRDDGLGGVDGRGGGGSRRDDEEKEKVEVFANPTLAQPAFFTSGNDFPAPSLRLSAQQQQHLPGEGLDGDGADSDVLNATMWAAAQNSDMDIILPVVSQDCALAQSAMKGSLALAELRRLMTREKINRDVMDTSKSDLAKLLKKDGALGQSVATTTGVATEGGNVGALPTHPHHPSREEGEGEEEALLRKIRLEKRNFTPIEKERAMSSAIAPASSRDDARQHAKTEKVAQIRGEQERLDAAVETEAALSHRAAIQETRQSLPIYRCKNELMRYVRENSILVVVGDTGSGKTTQLVQYLHEAKFAEHGMIIGCTQPRRLAAMGVARRVSEEMGCALGTQVGYSIHLDDTTTEETEIKFMTDGVLLREVVKDPDVNKYSVIILDEAHERSVDTDVLMGVLKLAVRRRNGGLTLIVTSATMDSAKFSRFFGNAPVYEIPGQTFPVEIRYSPNLVTDYVAEAVFRVCQLHLQAPLEGKHDILVFMTGRDDVYGTCELIKRRLQDINAKHVESLIVLPCLSEASSLTAHAGDSSDIGVLDPTPAGKRKCVVATNVAETSLTIDGVRYVVDCGFMKTNVFRPKIGMNTLQRYPISQAQAGQRKGRAGRTAEGVCFRLYTEEQFEQEMLPNSVPEIQRSSVNSVVLLLKSIGVARIVDFDFMDPPPVANTRNSMWHLWLLGLLDEHGAITAEGRLALEFPMSPALAKLLVESTQQGCSLEMLRIVALVTADPKNLFELPKGKEEIAQQHHGRFFNNESDHLTLLNAFTQFLDNGKSWQWAQDHFLHAPTLIRACDVLEQLVERLQRLKLPITACGAGGYEKVRYCIAKAFCLQAAQRSGSNWNEYRPLLNLGVLCTLHPSSSVCSRAEMPPFVVYNDLLLVSSKEYLVMVTSVDPEWLVTSSRGLYSLRRGGRQWNPPGEENKGESAKLGAGAAERVGSAAKPPAVPPPSKAVTAGKKTAAPPSKFGSLSGRRRQNI